MADLTPGMKTTIFTTSLALGGAGVLGAFAAHSDLIVIAPAWVRMFTRLSQQAGKSLDKARALKITTGVLAGAASLVGGIKLANSYFAWSGVGTLPAVVVNAGMNAVLTWLTGRAWAHIVLEEDDEQGVENLVRALLASVSAGLALGR